MPSNTVNIVAMSLYNQYNQRVKVNKLHSWQLSITQAIDLQQRMAVLVSKSNEFFTPRFIAGVDISVRKEQKLATGAVVVLSYPELEVVEIEKIQGETDFPYVPGLLSFRESPLILMACEKLRTTPDLILVDGQGIAHPRRFGLASHLGLFLDTPTIGCAKSLLCGSCEMPDEQPGNFNEIIDKDEIIGVALRTRLGVKPVNVSIGHKVDLQTAINLVLGCCRGYRIPEPTRLAHLAAGGNSAFERKFPSLKS